MKLAGRHGRPGRHSRLRLEFEPAEVALLLQLFDELEGLLTDGSGGPVGPDGLDGPGGRGGPPADDPVLARLYPAAHPDDDAASAEFRELTESGLRTHRIERIGACRADLHDGAVDLADADVGRRWIQAVNDLRLALGTRLGVSEDSPPDRDLDVTDPAQRPWVIYHWLTYLQDTVVQALMH